MTMIQIALDRYDPGEYSTYPQRDDKICQKVMIYVKCASKEIPKQFSRSEILNMAWNPYISAEK